MRKVQMIQIISKPLLFMLIFDSLFQLKNKYNYLKNENL